MSVRIINADVMDGSRGRFQKGQHWRSPKPHWDRAWLEGEYLTGMRSAAHIATEMGCDENNILYWLAKHGIPRRSMSQVRAVKHWGASGAANPMHGKRGALNPRYVDGSSPDRQRAYAQGEGKAFLRSILKRDGYRCRRCQASNSGERSLHVHHIAPWAGNERLRFDPSNVVTLCRPCHSWVHSKANLQREWLA